MQISVFLKLGGTRACFLVAESLAKALTPNHNTLGFICFLLLLLILVHYSVREELCRYEQSRSINSFWGCSHSPLLIPPHKPYSSPQSEWRIVKKQGAQKDLEWPYYVTVPLASRLKGPLFLRPLFLYSLHCLTDDGAFRKSSHKWRILASQRAKTCSSPKSKATERKI